MVPVEDRIGQVIGATAAGPALVALPVRLGLIPPLLDHTGRGAVGTANAIGPAEVADHLVALGVVGDPQDIDEHGGRSDVLRGVVVRASSCWIVGPG